MTDQADLALAAALTRADERAEKAEAERDRLAEALRAELADRERTAKYSFEDHAYNPPKFDDEIWEQEDPESFAIAQQSRAALAALTQHGDGK